MWTELEHKVHRFFLQRKGALQNSYFVALSGGMDSVALLRICQKIQQPVVALHCHHGPGENKKFRDDSLLFCQKICSDLGIEFYSFESDLELRSESEMRDFRYEKMLNFIASRGGGKLLTAHHLEDQLETRLLRLLRGTGHQGLIGIQEQNELIARPLLSVAKQEINHYIRSQEIEFIEDPSNQEVDYLRNWLREEMLPLLEAKSPGIKGSLARSLEILVEEWQALTQESLLSRNKRFCDEKDTKDSGSKDIQGIDVSFYLSLTLEERKVLIAQYLLSLKKYDFSQGQVVEIIKKLDNLKNEHTFRVAGLNWQVNAGQIKVVI